MISEKIDGFIIGFVAGALVLLGASLIGLGLWAALSAGGWVGLFVSMAVLGCVLTGIMVAAES
jgi:hypothetical protein